MTAGNGQSAWDQGDRHIFRPSCVLAEQGATGRKMSQSPVRRRRGTTAVEFAITAPILLFLLFASLELSRVNMIRQTANNAAYEAARTCIVPGATNAEGVAAAQFLLGSIGVIGSNITITPGTITDNTTEITATVDVPYSGNLWAEAMFFPSGSSTATCTLARDWVVSTRQAPQ